MAFANTCEISSPISKGRYFGDFRVVVCILIDISFKSIANCLIVTANLLLS